MLPLFPYCLPRVLLSLRSPPNEPFLTHMHPCLSICWFARPCYSSFKVVLFKYLRTRNSSSLLSRKKCISLLLPGCAVLGERKISELYRATKRHINGEKQNTEYLSREKSLKAFKWNINYVSKMLNHDYYIFFFLLFGRSWFSVKKRIHFFPSRFFLISNYFLYSKKLFALALLCHSTPYQFLKLMILPLYSN